MRAFVARASAGLALGVALLFHLYPYWGEKGAAAVAAAWHTIYRLAVVITVVVSLPSLHRGAAMKRSSLLTLNALPVLMLSVSLFLPVHL